MKQGDGANVDDTWWAMRLDHMIFELHRVKCCCPSFTAGLDNSQIKWTQDDVVQKFLLCVSQHENGCELIVATPDMLCHFVVDKSREYSIESVQIAKMERDNDM